MNKAEYKLAIEAFNKAVKLKPENVDYYKGRAQVYKKMEEFVLAEADEQKARDLEDAMENNIYPLISSSSIKFLL
jgi:Flp pilus assembly protein TadD